MKTKADRVRELRDAGMGIHQAKRVVERQDLDVEIRDAKTIDDLRGVLWSLNARLR